MGSPSLATQIEPAIVAMARFKTTPQQLFYPKPEWSTLPGRQVLLRSLLLLTLLFGKTKKYFILIIWLESGCRCGLPKGGAPLKGNLMVRNKKEVMVVMPPGWQGDYSEVTGT